MLLWTLALESILWSFTLVKYPEVIMVPMLTQCAGATRLCKWQFRWIYLKLIRTNKASWFSLSTIHACNFFAEFTYGQKKRPQLRDVWCTERIQCSANFVCGVCWLVALCFLTIEFRWTGYSLWRNREQFILHVLCYKPLNSVFKMSCNTRGCASCDTRVEGVKFFQNVISFIKNNTVQLSRNAWHQPPSDGVPHIRMTEISAAPLRKSKNSHKLCSSSTARCFHQLYVKGDCHNK